MSFSGKETKKWYVKEVKNEIEGDKVVDQYGAVLAEWIHGEWHSKDPAVLEFGKDQNTETKKVRARNEEGTLHKVMILLLLMSMKLGLLR